MLKHRLKLGSPFGTQPLRRAAALWPVCPPTIPHGGGLARCQALGESWAAGQPAPVRPAGSSEVMPFDIQVREPDAKEEVPAPPETAACTHPTEVGQQDSSSWEAWLKVFEQMDRQAEQQEFLKAALQDAVRREDYSCAASVKKELAAVQQSDAVADVQRQLAAALESEQYSDASKLRDQGMAWMQGWWAGVSDNDPVGHLLHVAPEFGRYTGRVYTARDLADLSGWRDGGSGLQQLRSALQADVSREEGVVGSPALEVFVVRDAQGELVHQAVSLMGDGKGKERDARKGRGKAGSSSGGTSEQAINTVASMLGLGPMMRISVVVHKDGSTRISAAHVQPDKEEQGRAGTKGQEEQRSSGSKEEGVLGSQLTMSKFNRWEADEAAAALRELAEVGQESSSSGSGSDSASSESSALAEAIREGSAQPQEQVLEQAPSARLAQGEVVHDEGAETAPEEPQASRKQPYDIEDTMIELDPQQYEALFGKDDDHKSERPATPQPPEERDSAADMVVDVSAARAVDIDATADHDEEEEEEVRSTDGEGLYTDLHRAAAQVDRVHIDQFVLRLAPDRQEQGGAGSGAGDSVVEQFEVLLPMGGMALSGKAIAAMTTVAERVARVQLQSGCDVDAAALRDAMHTLLANVTAGSAADVTIPAKQLAGASEGDAMGTTGQQGAAGSAGKREVRYTRVPADKARSDPFSGLYVGAFGPHGPELLRLRRVLVEGEEWVEAVKLTGDPNVPAGTVSFKAKIGRKHKLSAAQVYPEELGVVGRYKGQGQVAARGYTKPKWVEGELLVFSTSSNMTAGAELGFVWHVPGERKFLILLQKVDLQQCLEQLK